MSTITNSNQVLRAVSSILEPSSQLQVQASGLRLQILDLRHGSNCSCLDTPQDLTLCPTPFLQRQFGQLRG
jgi:hypothetical protein